MKEVTRRTLRPAWERVWTRIEARVAPIEARTGVSENRLDRLEVQLTRLEAGWNQHTPAFLNAVSSVSAFARHLERAERGQSELWEAIERAERGQSELWEATARTESSLWDAAKRAQEGLDHVSQRLEFVRTEALNELRYGSQLSHTQAGVDAQILAPTKLEEALAQDQLYLNLGCGHMPMEGYINVDSRELPGVDIVADIAKLPFDEASVDAIHSSRCCRALSAGDVVQTVTSALGPAAPGRRPILGDHAGWRSHAGGGRRGNHVVCGLSHGPLWRAGV